MTSESNKRNTLDREQLILETSVENFSTLLRIAGLDPGTDLRYADWSGVDFSNSDLRGFDFTGANLEGCRFDRALIEGARFEVASVERSALKGAKDWEEHVKSWKRPSRPPSARHLRDFAVFSDAPWGPEMMVVPAGSFFIGSSDKEANESAFFDDSSHADPFLEQEEVSREDLFRQVLTDDLLNVKKLSLARIEKFIKRVETDYNHNVRALRNLPKIKELTAHLKRREMPTHRVYIHNRFAISQTAINRSQLALYWTRVAWSRDPFLVGKEKNKEAVASYHSTRTWLNVMSEVTSVKYRLPSEVEWEYVAQLCELHRKSLPHKINRGETHEYKRASAFDKSDILKRREWEWCGDNWSDDYSVPRTQEYFRIKNSKHYVVRGGRLLGFRDLPRASARLRSRPEDYYLYAFRPVRDV